MPRNAAATANFIMLLAEGHEAAGNVDFQGREREIIQSTVFHVVPTLVEALAQSNGMEESEVYEMCRGAFVEALGDYEWQDTA